MNPTTHEILELARLDAIGMLDNDERVVFERAFQDASPALQEQIRREQNRLTDIGDLLPNVNPPQDLRARVVGAVRDAMTAVTGRNSDVLARMEPLAVNMRRKVTPVWRAACIGFATATVVLMGLGFYQQNSYDNALMAMRDGDIAELISREFGAEVKDTFFSPTAERVNFMRVADTTSGSGAVVLIDSETSRAFLLCENLPEIEGEYALVVIDAQGKVLKTITRFESAGGIKGLPLEGGLIPGSQFAIYASETPNEDAKPVLVSL